MTELGKKQDELIALLSDQMLQVMYALLSREQIIKEFETQLIDLCAISKIELGDDVIAEIQRLRTEIKNLED